MRIVVYSPTFSPVRDGTSMQASRLARALSRRHEVHALGYAVNRDMKRDIDLLKLKDRVERLPPDSVPGLEEFPRLSGQLAALRVRELGPRIVHICGWYQFDAVKALISSSSLSGAKIYWHGYGLHESHMSNKDKTDYWEILSYAIKSSICFIGNSAEDRELFLEIGVPENAVFIVQPFLQDARTGTKDWNHSRILSVGRFFEFKGYEKTIEVARKIDAGMDIIIAGASDTNYSESFFSRNRGRATIVANPSEDLMGKLYSFSTHFVLASKIESLGIATLEAVRAGCIPLARWIGGIGTYLPGKFLFRSDSELESKLRLLLGPIEAKKAHEELAGLRDSLSNDAAMKRLYEIYEATQ